MKKLFLLLFIGYLCFPPVFSQVSETDSVDNQFWHETQLSFPLIKTENDSGKTTDKLSFFINGNLRIGRNIRHLIDERIGLGFDYKYNKYVSFTQSYLYIAQQPSTGVKQFESRARFAVNLEKSWKKFSLGDRNLVEYRFRNNRSDSVRYRNRFRFIYPIKKNKKELFVPFATNEIFYDFQAKTFSRNELSVGISRKLSSNVTTDYFYLLQTNKSGSPKQLNVFGVNLKIRVD
jgi:hypothetical protein